MDYNQRNKRKLKITNRKNLIIISTKITETTQNERKNTHIIEFNLFYFMLHIHYSIVLCDFNQFSGPKSNQINHIIL